MWHLIRRTVCGSDDVNMAEIVHNGFELDKSHLEDTMRMAGCAVLTEALYLWTA